MLTVQRLFIDKRDLDKFMIQLNLGLGEELLCLIQIFNV